MMRTPSVSSGRLSRGNSSSAISAPSLRSDLEQLVVLVLERGVDVGFPGVGELVEFFLGPGQLVFRGVTIFHERVELVARSPPDVADGDFALLCLVLDPLHEFAPPL